MSWEARQWAERMPIVGVAKAVLWHLADHHNEKTGQCNPSADTIAARLGLSRTRTIRDVIGRLIDMGLISRRRRFNKPSSFVLHLDLEAPADGRENGRDTSIHSAERMVVPRQVNGRTSDHLNLRTSKTLSGAAGRTPACVRAGGRAEHDSRKSKTESVAAREAGHARQPGHAHDEGREGHEARRDNVTVLHKLPARRPTARRRA